MGMLFRMLAPKPLKKARRAMHPLSAITPNMANVRNPTGAARRAVKREAVRETIPIRKSQRPNTKAARRSPLFVGCWISDKGNGMGQITEVLPDGSGMAIFEDGTVANVRAG